MVPPAGCRRGYRGQGQQTPRYLINRGEARKLYYLLNGVRVKSEVYRIPEEVSWRDESIMPKAKQSGLMDYTYRCARIIRDIKIALMILLVIILIDYNDVISRYILAYNLRIALVVAVIVVLLGIVVAIDIRIISLIKSPCVNVVDDILYLPNSLDDIRINRLSIL